VEIIEAMQRSGHPKNRSPISCRPIDTSILQSNLTGSGVLSASYSASTGLFPMRPGFEANYSTPFKS
jgi:hypothetical protein